jgi:hypothetical protein
VAKKNEVFTMRSYKLNIAGYCIGFEAAASGPELVPSQRFLRNICTKTESDLQITVHSGAYILPHGAGRVFHAPFVEELNGVQIRHKANFWSIWKHRSDLFIRTIFPMSSEEKNAVLKFSLLSSQWELWIEGADTEIDPFEYPLDGLILYYLTVINGDVMIHASGVNNLGRGYIFSGVSGKGKSTIAGLWDKTGGRVIHDDRLIVRKSKTGYIMHNTPVYNNDEPHESPLHKIFIIEHGPENRIVPVKGALAVSLVMANCIQHNWGHDLIARLLGSVSIMCGTIPVVRLSFKPDRSVIDYILENE